MLFLSVSQAEQARVDTFFRRPYFDFDQAAAFSASS